MRQHYKRGDRVRVSATHDAPGYIGIVKWCCPRGQFYKVSHAIKGTTVHLPGWMLEGKVGPQ